MPSQKNITQLQFLKYNFSKAKSVVIADYSGLSMADQTDLRSKIKQSGGEIKVAKNRLFKLAVKGKYDSSPELDAALARQNAFIFSYDDAVSAIKALYAFASDHQALEIKLGLLDDKVLSQPEIEALSKLPSKKELISILIARINGPSFGLVNVLSAPARGLVSVLAAIKDKQKNN